jgi:hydroxyethylthiazole kinase
MNMEANHQELGKQAGELLARIRAGRPLIHQITNFVVMNDTANVTLHVGALPVMAHAREEVEEMVGLAGALVLNPGTLTPEWVESMLLAGKRANQLGVPVVLDPVGAGATKLRTESNLRLLTELQIAVLRGNAGEIGALAGERTEVRGVESISGPGDILSVARGTARKYRTVVAVTGKRDLITDGARTLAVDNGHEWLTTLTGTGCSSTAVVAAFCAVERDYVLAAAVGLAYFGLVAQLAAPQANGPATFKVAFYDQLYNLTPGQLAEGAQITALEPATAGVGA